MLEYQNTGENICTQIMREAQRTKQVITTTTKSLYTDRTTTTWTATPNEHGGVDLTYKINYPTQ